MQRLPSHVLVGRARRPTHWSTVLRQIRRGKHFAHSDGTHLAAAAFGDRGGQRGGNGRRLNKKGEYTGFAGNIVLYELGTA